MRDQETKMTDILRHNHSTLEKEVEELKKSINQQQTVSHLSNYNVKLLMLNFCRKMN